MNNGEKLQAAVPQGKAMGWLLGAAAICYMAGVGSVAVFGEYRELPATVEEFQDTVRAVGRVAAENRDAIEEITDSLSLIRRDVTRIRCLSRLTATGQTVQVFEIDTICPP